MTPYQDIFNKFNIACLFYDLDSMATADAEEFLIALMGDAIINFRSTKIDLTDRDDTVKTFNIDLEPIIQKIIAEYMVYGWTQRYLHDQDLLEQFMSSNAIKTFSPAAHISQLRDVNKEAKINAQRLEKQYSISNNIGNLG